MKVSGREVADEIAKKLHKEIQNLKISPTLAIILAGEDPSSRMYVDFKIKRAKQIGIKIRYFQFNKDQYRECIETIRELNVDKKVHGIIIQYPIYEAWDFDEVFSQISPQKDVDGFHENSSFKGATALGVWEMLKAFALIEGFKNTKDFLKGKKIIVLGRGKTAGEPITDLLKDKGFEVEVISSKTENPNELISKGDVVISATGIKNIINKSNLKKGSYVIGVGVGKEKVGNEEKIYGDINEEDVSKIAKLYCPTIGGIGPLTIISLLSNVTLASQKN